MTSNVKRIVSLPPNLSIQKQSGNTYLFFVDNILQIVCVSFMVRAIGGEVHSDGDFLLFEGNRYSRKGFLYKNFTMSAILVDGVKPTLAELERFEEQPEGKQISYVNFFFNKSLSLR